MHQKGLRARIVALSPRAELLLVIAATSGLHLAAFAAHVALRGFNPRIEFSEQRLVNTIALELILALAIGWCLTLRGWRAADLPLSVNPRSTLTGVGLWLAVWLTYVAVALSARAILGERALPIAFHGRISLPVVLLVCAVNPLFEEALLLGYLIRALRPHGAVFAIGVSVLLRTLAHAYQGPMAVFSIVPMGLIFAAYFWRAGNLWPAVFAHVIADFIGLSSLR